MASEDPAGGPEAAPEDTRVTVAIRLRPPAESQDEEAKEMYRLTPTTVTVRDPLSKGRSENTFTFSKVLLPEHGQETVQDLVARPLVDQVLKGYNACCFAYGQTGSGKTHSVFGEPSTAQRGMLPRSLEYLFQMVERQADFKEVGIVVSFVEIYLNQVRDLGRFYASRSSSDPAPSGLATATAVAAAAANGGPQGRRRSACAGGRWSSKGSGLSPARPSSPKRASRDDTDAADPYMTQDLAIHESPSGQVYIEDLSTIPVTCTQDALDVANLGMRMRATYETKLNTSSSRSHAIFTISIAQKTRGGSKTGVVGSMMNFCDLAGSERLARSQSEGRRFQEAVLINSSLTALGKVVLAIAGGGARHVPYRDSKLTRILQNSLGGSAYTTLLTTINPSPSNYEESMNSLLFADRCKSITNRPTQNIIDQEQGSSDRLIHQLLREIVELKSRVSVSHVLPPPGSQPGVLDQTLPLDQTQPLDQTRLLAIPEAEQSSAASAASAVRSGPALAGGAPMAAGTAAPGAGLGDARRVPSVPSGTAEKINLFRLEEQGRAQLKVERARRKEAERLVDATWGELQDRRQAHASWDATMRADISENQLRAKELELEIQKYRSKLSSLGSTVGALQAGERQMLESHAAEVQRDKEELMGKASAGWKLCSPREAAATFERKCDEMLARRGEWHDGVCEGIESGHIGDVGAMEQQYRQFLSERQMEEQRLTSEIERCVTEGQRQRQQLHGDLVDAHDLVLQLGRMVDQLVTGVPNDLRMGIRPPPPPPEDLGARLAADGLLSDRLLDGLRKGMAEVRRQVTRSRQVGSLAVVAPGAGAADDDRAGDISRGFCGGGIANAELHEPLQSLGPRQLRAACLSLRGRARMSTEETEAERARLFDEVACEFDGHGSLEVVRALEAEIGAYRDGVRKEEEKLGHASVALRSCERSSACSAPRPASSGPRAVDALRARG